MFLHTNIFCDPSLEPSQRDGSNKGSQDMFSFMFCDSSLELSHRHSDEGSQDMFSLRNKKNYP